MNTNKKIIKELLETEHIGPKTLELSKRKIMRELKIFAPTKISLLKSYQEMSNQEKKSIAKKAGIVFDADKDRDIRKSLITRPVRSLSGIVNVSVLTKPYPCPGKCIYCPDEIGMPKSYIKSEPAAMRAAMNKFNPQKQVNVRIKSLEITGHPVDKIELRIIGGTWSFYPKKYQDYFVKKLFDACNKRESKNLKEAQKINEKSKHRIVGLSVETRPDFINKKEIKRLRNFGVTSVELGIQAIDNKILKKIKRGHNVKSIIEATKILKDAGFKICYQIMLNLPGSNIKKDEKIFKELFDNPSFRPDYLKIYPLAIIKGTEMYQMWKRKKYIPYSDKKLKELLKKTKMLVPYYVRIQRLMRDIPIQNIEAGTKKSNLREIITKELEKESLLCKCIRYREVKGLYNPTEKIKMFREDYEASDGKEIFLTFENFKRQKLYSLLRIRITNNKLAIIRELHTYGQQLRIKQSSYNKNSSPQHKGLGKKLMKKAEDIALKEFNLKKITVISAVGTRSYYRKLGYRLNKTYMVKIIGVF